MATRTSPLYVYFDPGHLYQEHGISDEMPNLYFNARTAEGAAFDLSSAVVKLTLVNIHDRQKPVNGATCSVISATAGTFYIQLSGANLTQMREPSDLEVQVELTVGSDTGVNMRPRPRLRIVASD